MTFEKLRALYEMLEPAMIEAPPHVLGRFREAVVRIRNAIVSGKEIHPSLRDELRSAAHELAREYRERLEHVE